MKKIQKKIGWRVGEDVVDNVAQERPKDEL